MASTSGSSTGNSAVGVVTELEEGEQSSTAAVFGGRRRAAAFSYSRVRSASSKAARPRTVTGSGGKAVAREAGGSGSDSGSSGEMLECTFVNDIPDECCCGMCGELMEEPVQTQCCQTDYCHPCVRPHPPPDNHSNRKKPKPPGVVCPKCKTANTTLRDNEELKKKVESLHVKCVYVSAGCVWEGERAWLKDHVEMRGGCLYAPVICSNCGMELRKKEETNHALSECPLRLVQCQYCHIEDTFTAITTHHYQDCHNYPVTCTLNCGETLPRGKLQYHLNYECSSRGHQCPFRALGCSAYPISSNDIDTHVKSCGVARLVDMFRRFTSEIEDLRNQVHDLRTENQSLRREVKSATATMATTQVAVETLQVRNETLSHTLVQELEYYCRAKEPSELIAVECMKTQLASGLIHLQAGGSPATLRMMSYSSHKESGQVWLSPPFYLHAGYKLRLGVHVNGVGAGKGSHMSIYLHQMIGERDDQLEWPYLLKDRVKVSLLKQTEYQRPSSATTSRGLFFGRRQQLSTSPDSFPLSLSLPPNASPIRQVRRIADEQRSPPLKDSDTALVAIETQSMAVTSYLRRVDKNQSSLGGRVVSKIDLFCTQLRVIEAVYYDSLVFQCMLCSGNLSDGSLAC